MRRLLATDYTPRGANFAVTLRFEVLRAPGSRSRKRVSRILEPLKPVETSSAFAPGGTASSQEDVKPGAGLRIGVLRRTFPHLKIGQDLVSLLSHHVRAEGIRRCDQKLATMAVGCERSF
ncbi:hypothetical protein MRX96_055506 [Rhipicephalus microplus]